MAGSKSFFLALILALPAAARQTTQDDCKPIKIVAALQDSPTHYQAQLLGDLDRPVGEGVKLKTAYLPATVNDKGNLELDVHNDGKTRTLSPASARSSPSPSRTTPTSQRPSNWSSASARTARGSTGISRRSTS